MDDLDEWYQMAKLGLYGGAILYSVYMMSQNPTLFWTVLVTNRMHTWYCK